MVIEHGSESYKVKAVQSTVCPAGTAYWLIQVHHIPDYRFDGEKMVGTPEEMAIVSISTGAIYGSPTLANYLDEIHAELNKVLSKLNR